MNIPQPNVTHGFVQIWYCTTQDDAEQLITALRAKFGDKEVISGPSYSLRLLKYLVTCIDTRNL